MSDNVKEITSTNFSQEVLTYAAKQIASELNS